MVPGFGAPPASELKRCLGPGRDASRASLTLLHKPVSRLIRAVRVSEHARGAPRLHPGNTGLQNAAAIDVTDELRVLEASSCQGSKELGCRGLLIGDADLRVCMQPGNSLARKSIRSQLSFATSTLGPNPLWLFVRTHLNQLIACYQEIGAEDGRRCSYRLSGWNDLPVDFVPRRSPGAQIHHLRRTHFVPWYLDRLQVIEGGAQRLPHREPAVARSRGGGTDSCASQCHDSRTHADGPIQGQAFTESPGAIQCGTWKEAGDRREGLHPCLHRSSGPRPCR